MTTNPSWMTYTEALNNTNEELIKYRQHYKAPLCLSIASLTEAYNATEPQNHIFVGNPYETLHQIWCDGWGRSDMCDFFERINS